MIPAIERSEHQPHQRPFGNFQKLSGKFNYKRILQNDHGWEHR